jgi:hypothetical protein
MNKLNKITTLLILGFGIWSPWWCIGHTSPYDVNCDLQVSVLDLVQVACCFDEVGFPGWIKEDLNKDGQISVVDLVLVANHFDEVYI